MTSSAAFHPTLASATLAHQFHLHPQLTGTLDQSDRAIRDQEQFRQLHTAYERAAMVQWFAGLMHLWLVVSNPLSRKAVGKASETPK